MSKATTPLTPRSACEVIDAAIRDNRTWEYLCLSLTATFALSGVAVLVLGAVRGEGLVALSGSVAGALFWPAMRFARGIQRENIALRLLEIPLAQAKTAKEAAELIRETIQGLVPKKGNDGHEKS